VTDELSVEPSSVDKAAVDSAFPQTRDEVTVIFPPLQDRDPVLARGEPGAASSLTAIALILITLLHTLQVPLQLLIDFGGYRVTASAVIPATADQLVYGSVGRRPRAASTVLPSSR
jgi:hypothetical protein